MKERKTSMWEGKTDNKIIVLLNEFQLLIKD